MRNIKEDRKKFNAYDAAWEHTFFDEETGGFLVTDMARKYKINKTPLAFKARGESLSEPPEA